MNYTITRNRDRYPSPAHACICSWCLLVRVYTRYNSNPTVVLCTGHNTLFANYEHNHGLPDFPYNSSTHTFYKYFLPGTFVFPWLSSIAPYVPGIYQVYIRRIIPGILYRAYWNYTIVYAPGTYISGICIQQYTCGTLASHEVSY